MGKYTPQQLKSIAIDAVNREGRPDYLSKIMTLAIKTGLNPQEVERRIRTLAQG